VIPALQSLSFDVDCSDLENELEKKLDNDYDVIWLLSGCKDYESGKCSSCAAFFEGNPRDSGWAILFILNTIIPSFENKFDLTLSTSFAGR